MRQRDWHQTGVVIAAALVGAGGGALFATQLALGDVPFAQVVNLLPSAVLWILFFGFWGLAARERATTNKSERALSSAIHQISLTFAFVLLFLPIVPSLTARFLPDSVVFVVLGICVQVAFAALAVWARRHLGRNWSAEVRIAEGHTLVISGPYRRIRHPIYTAMLGMFLGTALASGQVHALLALIVLGVAYWRKISLEERYLHDAFATEFAEYRQRSWRLVPFLF